MTRIVPYKGDDSFLFVSYSHNDEMQVLEILSYLQNRGCRLWYDEGIDPGTEWDEYIAEHIETSDAVVAFISENYLRSDNCKDELNYARDLGKDRLLIYIEQVKLPSGMAMRLNRLQAIHTYSYRNPNDAYAKIAEAPMVLRNTTVPQRPAPPQMPLGFGVPPKQSAPDFLQIGDQRFYSPILISSGFTGSIYMVVDREEGRVYTAKQYHASVAQSIPMLNDPILAHQLKQIDHPNVCKLHEIDQNGSNCTLSDHLKGETLEAYMKGYHADREKLQLFRQILQGLAALHDSKIYYGDLTPANIMVVKGRAVLCDFGEANFNGRKKPDVTRLLQMISSPESDKGQVITFQSDIYQAGILLDMLTLRTINENIVAVAKSHKRDLNLEIPQWHFPLDEQLLEIIKKATRYAPENRYESVNQMLQDLDEAIQITPSSTPLK